MSSSYGTKNIRGVHPARIGKRVTVFVDKYGSIEKVWIHEGSDLKFWPFAKPFKILTIWFEKNALSAGGALKNQPKGVPTSKTEDSDSEQEIPIEQFSEPDSPFSMNDWYDYTGPEQVFTEDKEEKEDKEEEKKERESPISASERTEDEGHCKESTQKVPFVSENAAEQKE